MSSLTGKRILLGATGGIAAYKSAYLLRRLIEAGAEIRVVMTAGATAFIQPLTFQALSGNPVHTDLLDPAAEAAMGHIELARWADFILIAPASANTLARLAHGLADDLLSTLCLATDAPIHVAPAMNRLMWQNPATQHNCELLLSRGVQFHGPGDGAQACGETGSGRMLEPDDICTRLAAIAQNPATAGHSAATAVLSTSSATSSAMPSTKSYADKSFADTRILITAGPTREPIDPVRYLSNRSSGKMGFALAAAAHALGADVTLIAGPVSLDTPAGVNRIDVITADDMLAATSNAAGNSDIFISVAAVADYRLDNVSKQKIKKTGDSLQLDLIRNPDILKTIAARPDKPFCVGFAAETEKVEAHARGKLEAKKLDMIAANHVAQAGNPVFGTDTNSLDVYWPDQGFEHIPSNSKDNVAMALLGIIATQFRR